MISLLRLGDTPIRSTVPRIAARSEPARSGNIMPFRIPNEFYPTPPVATRALLAVEQFDGPIWEPACGDGGIAKVLKDEFRQQVIATDLIDYGYGIPKVDFLDERTARAKHIITNPPYGFGLGDAFAARALWLTAETGGKVAFLLNLTSLCHAKRNPWFRANRPARIWAIDNIVCWPDERHGYGTAPKYFAKHRYCWVVWDHNHDGPTAFDWLSSCDYR